MADIHIADFYKDVARIFTQLYLNFPRKITLFVEDISGPDSPDEFGLHCTRFQSCFSTMLWLAETGYIHYESTIRQEALDQVTLSHKGFTVLYARLDIEELSGTDVNDAQDLPASVQESYASGIYLVRQALKSGSSTAIEHVIQSLLRK